MVLGGQLGRIRCNGCVGCALFIGVVGGGGGASMIGRGGGGGVGLGLGLGLGCVGLRVIGLGVGRGVVVVRVVLRSVRLVVRCRCLRLRRRVSRVCVLVLCVVMMCLCKECIEKEPGSVWLRSATTWLVLLRWCVVTLCLVIEMVTGQMLIRVRVVAGPPGLPVSIVRQHLTVSPLVGAMMCLLARVRCVVLSTLVIDTLLGTVVILVVLGVVLVFVVILVVGMVRGVVVFGRGVLVLPR